MQTVKEFLRKPTKDSVQTRLARFLLQHRITPHSTTGTSPAELLLKRRPRSHLDLALPDVSRQVSWKQQQQKWEHDKHSRSRYFQINDLIYVRKFPGNDGWLPGKVIKITGPLSYFVELTDGRILRRHVDYIQQRMSDSDMIITGTQSEWLHLPDLPSIPTSPNTHLPPLRRLTRILVPPTRYPYN